MDLTPTMERIVKKSFPKAKMVADRFHVQQLASDAVQQIRIDYRWEAIEQENKEMQLAKEAKQPFVADVLENGDTLKQLLVRSRYLFFKKQQDWSVSQVRRSEILFRLYPDLQHAYQLSRQLSDILPIQKKELLPSKD